MGLASTLIYINFSAPTLLISSSKEVMREGLFECLLESQKTYINMYLFTLYNYKHINQIISNIESNDTWMYYYYIPANQFIDGELRLIVGVLWNHPCLLKVGDKIYSPTNMDGQILKDFLEKLNDKIDFEKQRCRWKSQIYMGALLDEIEIEYGYNLKLDWGHACKQTTSIFFKK